MSPQITEQIAATPPAPPPIMEKPVLPRPRPTSTWARVATRRNVFWFFVAVAVGLNATIAYIGYVLLNEPRTIETPSQQSLHVPYANNKGVLDRWRRWPVQEGGRIKPFDTFCIEAVRTITGREKFEGKDPVALVLSWMMTFRPTTADEGIDYARIDEASKRDYKPVFWTSSFEFFANEAANSPDRKGIEKIAKKLDCNWDGYAFILCDYHELRKEILREKKGDKAELNEEEIHGKYMSPFDLRNSSILKSLARKGRAKRAEDPKATIPVIESKAGEVDNRLRMYERTCSLGEFGAVAMDPFRREWFRLDFLRYAFVSPPKDQDGKPVDPRVIWDHWQKDMRVQHDLEYEGKPKQDFPGKQSREAVEAFQAVQEAYVTRDDEKFSGASEKFFNTVDRVGKELTEYPDTNTIDLELTFNRAIPFRSAWIFGLATALVLALCLLVGGTQGSLLARGLYGLGMLGYATAVGFAVYGFYCRIAISGRPPVGNMYESIIWVAFMTAIFGLGLELVYRRGVIALAGGLISTLGFLLADQLPTTFSPAIEPLSAVLRSQYWLIIHVLMIVSSYAALALAWGLGNINIALILFAPGRGALIKRLSHYSYKAIQIGVIMLFFGTMLGGFWAAESWGRFWGWDVKEVWALIAFLCYIIPLHARYVGWIKDFGLAACSVICFSAVVMAWYGVNFILGTGMHSYGFGSGNNGWVYLGAVTNISLVVHAGLRYMAQGGHRAVVD